MITVLIFAVIAFFIGFNKLVERHCFGLGDRIFMSFIFSFIGGLFGFLIAMLISSKTTTDHDRIKLGSLQDNTGINGSFFLGSGNIKDEMKYVFYVQQSDSSYKLNSVSCKKASIIYSNNQPAEHIYTTRQKGSKWLSFGVVLPEVEYVFEVPKGSIKNHYVLDAQ
jgi:hypothetical protein